MAADGSVSVKRNSVSVALAEADKGHLENLSRVLGYDGGLLYECKTKSFRLNLYGAERMLYDLENVYNVVPNKSLKLKYPEGLEHWGDQFKKAYLVGYIDGDGCIRYDKRDGLLVLDVFGGSRRLISWAREFIETSYGFKQKKIFVSKNGRAFLYRLIG